MNINKQVIALIAARYLNRKYKYRKQRRILDDVNLFHQIIECMCNNQIPKVQNYVEVINSVSDSTFRSHFRMCRGTFEILLNHLAPCPEFEKRNEAMGGRTQISIQKTLLVVLWVFATPDSYRSVADRFDVGKGTVVHLIDVVVSAVLNNVCKTFIKWPSSVLEKRQNSMGFRKYGLPNIIGAIDGCHIPIKRPIENAFDYYNRNKYYSMVLQGICNQNLMFIDCDVRWLGSVHDSRVLRTSDFYPHAEELCSPNYYIIGDSAYPVKSWLIPPFKNVGNLTPQQIYFNTQLSKTRVVIENTFALLKGRFRRLKYLEMKYPEAVVRTIICCCVLHNICLLHSDEDVLEYIHEDREDAILMVLGNYPEARQDGQARNEMVQYVWNNRRNV